MFLDLIRKEFCCVDSNFLFVANVFPNFMARKSLPRRSRRKSENKTKNDIKKKKKKKNKNKRKVCKKRRPDYEN